MCLATAATVPMRKDILILVWMSFERYFEIESEKEQNEVLDEAKIKENGVLGALGALLGVFGAFWWEFLAKLGRRSAQDGRSWGQVGGKSRPRWAMMTLRWAMMAPRWAMIALRWAMIAPRWAMIAPRWAF